MAPRTPQQPYTAGAFVTLSLPKPAASKLPGSRSDNVMSVKSNTGSSASKRSKKRVQSKVRSSTESIAAHSPPQHLGFAMPPSPTSPCPSSPRSASPAKGVSLPTNHISSQNDVSNQLPSSDNKTWSLAKTMGKGDSQKDENQVERRSSTASLTDAGTRSSNRTRKLTTKAQALAGTSFLPSLQTAPDGDMTPNVADGDLAPEYGTNEPDYPTQVNTPPLTLDTTITEPPLESVETPTVRTSARERKPTARAIELESERALRKRPASPLSAERTAKMLKTSPATSIKSSHLRNSTMEADDVSIEKIEETTKDVPKRRLIEIISDDDDEVPESLEAPDIVISEAATPSPDYASQEPGAAQNESIQAQPQPPEKEPMCDLACLSPSSRLFTFAKIASEWPESDDDSDDEIDVHLELSKASSEDSYSWFDKARKGYCRCSHDPKKVNLIVAECKPLAENESRKDDINSIDSAKISTHSKDIKNLNDEIGLNITPLHGSDQRKPKTPLRSVRQRRAKQQRPSMLRQSSSFEQRMQADYLASNNQESPSSQKHSGPASPAENLALAKDTTPGIEIPTTQTLDNTVSFSGPDNGVSSTSDPVVNGGQEKVIEEVFPNTSQFQEDHVSGSVEKDRPSKKPRVETGKSQKAARHVKTANQPAGSKHDQKPINDAAHASKRTGGKSSAAGSVRESLGDKSGTETGHITKQYQAFAPPQAKSIRLRFTTTNK